MKRPLGKEVGGGALITLRRRRITVVMGGRREVPMGEQREYGLKQQEKILDKCPRQQP